MLIKTSYLGETFETQDKVLEIIGEDNRPLYHIQLLEDGTLEVSSSSTVKFNDKILNTQLSVLPKASNLIHVKRVEYK